MGSATEQEREAAIEKLNRLTSDLVQSRGTPSIVAIVERTMADIRQMVARTLPGIEMRESRHGREPFIRETRLAVRHVGVEFDRGGMLSVLQAYPHVPPVALIEAVGYYVRHREEMEQTIKANSEVLPV